MVTKDKKEKNTVFIGKKDFMAYVLAVIAQFNNGEKTVVIKARGRAISMAVDVAEVTRMRFVTGVNVKDVNISTEEIKRDEMDRPNKVSAIEIILVKG